MGKSTRIAPWWSLAAGLYWLLKFARDTWAPGFLSFTGHHEDSWIGLVAGPLFILAACRGFINMRRVSTR
jgi:hypothetical protein